MFNKIILVGNLTRDLEIRYSSGGMAIANTAIATSRKFTSNGEKKTETCFVDITFFARSAEIANQYLRKGSKILVEGRLNFDQWVDQNGQKRSKHSVVVETMQMLDSKGDVAQNQPQNDSTAQQQSYAQPRQSHQAPSTYDEPQQQSQQTMDYDGKAIPSQQQQSYQQPARQMPSSNEVPVIDIDDEEPPF